MIQPKRQIIIDTDPGCDDAIALLLALASPDIEVLGITTIMGNSTIDRTTGNALKLCELVDRPDIGVYPGCPVPMLVPLDTAEIVHGSDGMAELDLPDPVMQPGNRHAVDFIIDTVMAHPPGSITLCALGPLTNVALAIVKDRRIAGRLDRIAIMGGSLFAGSNHNTFIAAETNFANDPHAARIVFESGAKLVLAPLDLTHATLATPERIAAIRAVGTRMTAHVADIMTFYSRYDVEKMGLAGGPIHDPCIIAWLIAPQLFKSKQIFAEVETQSERTMGMVVADWWGVTGKPANVTVLHEIDSDGFFNLLADRLSQL